jgi:predicted CXXCH cytochrome family protein
MTPLWKRSLWIAVAAVALPAGAFFIWRNLHQSPVALGYVGTETCASCHKDAYQKWRESDHRRAMEVASSQSVLGNFNDASFDYSGIKSRFFTRDGKYYVETDNAKGELEIFQVAYTFGYYPLQQYLIAFPDGRMQALSIAWDSRPGSNGGQRWYHLYPDQKVTHDDPLHWTGAFQNWNSRCASCHSTDIVKNYSRETDRYDTRWQELTVGCEACHGAGSRHVAWAKGNRSYENKGLVTQLAKVWTPVEGKHDGKLPIPPEKDFSETNSAMSQQLQVCSGCHSLRGELQHADVSASYFDNYTLSPLLDGRYYPDGQIRAEVYETGSFLQSRMHENHVSCTNCHDPHSGHVRAKGNELCLQCHDAGKFQTPQHFFHKTESAGAQCVNCHMAQETYMGVDARRDHSFRVPDPAASVAFGVPNACTQCHKDKDNRWAANIIAQHTGHKAPRYPYGELLAGARKNNGSVAPDLLAYEQNKTNPPILRSIALLESTRFPSPQQVAAINASLASNDPLVRLGAVSALAGLEPNERLSRLRPLLNDPVKSVRMTVARQLIDVPLAQAPQDVHAALDGLFKEYRETLLFNADMPESMNDLGLFLGSQGDFDGAERAIQHARKLAPRYLPAMLNLSDIYRAKKRDDLGEPLLKEAMAAYPESGDARHALGLLYVRTGREKESVPLFAQASRLAPDNAQYALVYGLALIENGSRAEGIQALRAAAQRFPGNAPIRQALEAL